MVVPYNSVPLVYRNVVVVGANTPPGTPGGIGNARAYDARTGAKLWEFSSVPQPGEVGHDTWEGDSWRGPARRQRLAVLLHASTNRAVSFFCRSRRRSAAPMAAIGRAPICSATRSSRSTSRPASTGGTSRRSITTCGTPIRRRRPPCSTSCQNGRTVPALALTTKSGYLYILNRETGQPIFGVEERPVPKSDVPGELASPTQPIPVKPPPIARVGYQPDDLVTRGRHDAGARAGLRGACRKSRRRDQCRPVHAVAVSAPRAHRRRARSCFPADWAAPTGVGPQSIPRRGSCSWRRRMSARSAGSRTRRASRGSPAAVPYVKTTPGRARSTCRCPVAAAGRARSRRGAG